MSGEISMKAEQGIVLSADAMGFVPMVESMSPMASAPLLLRIQHFLHEQACVAGAEVIDIVADALLAHWAWPLEIDGDTVIDLATRLAYGAPELPFRVGIHFGNYVRTPRPGMSGCVQLVGDTINTTHRLQTLNKRLHTRMLASSDLVLRLPGIVGRRLGYFDLAGKQQQLEVYEVFAEEAVERLDSGLVDHFAVALAWYEEGNAEEAEREFGEIATRWPNDGPSRYYLQRLNEMQTEGL